MTIATSVRSLNIGRLPLLSYALIALCGCNRSAQQSAGSTNPIAPVVSASRATLANTLTVAGEFIPYQEVELHAKVAGYIRRINVDIGDRVKQGQVLAVLDVPELQAQVDAAKSALNAMQQQLGVSQAQQQQVSTMEDYSRIIAPFNGVVTWRYADTGALIQAGTSNAGSAPVVKVAEISTLRLRLPVPEAIAPYVRDGDTATIRVDALGRTIIGKVTRSTDALDASTRSMQVEIDVPNADDSLTPGMYAQVTLNVRRTGDALVVPIQAVDTSGPQPILLVVNAQSRVERRVVQTGIATANRVEILSGLREGEQVIVANQASFQPGELVTAKQSAMAASGATDDSTEAR